MQKKEKGRQRMRWLDSITNSMEMNLSKLWEMVKESLACCNPWGRRESDMTERPNRQQTVGVERPLTQPWGVLVVCQAQCFLWIAPSVVLTALILILQKKATEAQRS